MKPQLLKINTPTGASFNIFEQGCPFFPTPWHFHPEIEIVWMQHSTGKKYIGTSIEDFYPDDLVMIGSYVPHFYKNDSVYLEGKTQELAKSTVIHFLEDFMGNDFFLKPENQKVYELLQQAKRGIQFSTQFCRKIQPQLCALSRLEGMDRLLIFLSILNEMSKETEVKYLNSYTIAVNNPEESARIKRIFAFVMQHFQQEIHLEEVASLANLSPSAFSRYFKQRTRQTFSSVLAEIRIEHACKLIQNPENSIADVCFASGFQNLSNFNRHFKKIKKLSPLDYRHQFEQ